MISLRFDVAGAEGATQFFSRLTKATIAHAYLFSGPSGVGKKTFAHALAQSILCRAPHPRGVLGYDGTCESCVLFGKEMTRHPDLLESVGPLKIGEPEEALSFHEAEHTTSRDLVRLLSLQSYAGGYRIFILGDVEFASPAAANALLKFFEEPPDNVLLLLTTTTPARLLDTIRSRLVEVRFSPLRRRQVVEILRARGFAEKEARAGAALSQGSVTRALSALADDQDQLRAQVAAWFFRVVAGGRPDQSWAARETLDEGLEVLRTLVRDWIAVSHAGKDAGPLAADYAAKIKELRPIPADHAIRLLEKLSQAQRLAATNVTPALVGEFVRMSLTPNAQRGGVITSARGTPGSNIGAPR